MYRPRITMGTVVKSINVVSISIHITFFFQNSNMYYDDVQSIRILVTIVGGYRLGTYTDNP